ncbi:lantibiotic dehydratase [uncultured Tenacibaculum sp.]|uniref:lantibiotic dehydratase n=1 Tax=uncultured Tenacibaculum sp. TaxID=174713 RepID=UPI00261F2C6E|nr:lantibiotic dehydratase [uncultured Tenacibaculum sp.]
MNNFPFLFGRKGGGSFNLLEKLCPLDIQKKLDTVIELFDSLEQEKERMNNVIHTTIGDIKESNDINILINYKRDLFNNRNVEKYLTKIKYPIIQNDLKSFIKKVEDYQNDLNLFNNLYQIELLNSIEKLKKITDKTFFKNGMLFSSEILYKQINKSDFKFIQLNKKKKKLVISVLKYLTRSVTKTTPYSSFNNIFCLEYNKEKNLINSVDQNYSSVQIINLFFHYLKELLIKQKGFTNILEIKLNSTIKKQEKQVINYFLNKDNNESFKNIGENPLILFILDYIKENSTTYKSLIDKIQSVTDESEEDIINYIEVLINEGFLILKYPVSSTQPNWIYDLKQKLESISEIDIDFSASLIELLTVIIEEKKKLEINHDVENRKKIIEILYQKIVLFFKIYKPDSEFSIKVKERDLFYEDTISSLQVNIPSKEVNILTNSLSEIYQLFNSILRQKKELKRFLGTFMDSKQKMTVLELYEKIYLKQINNFTFEKEAIEEFNKLMSKIVHKIESNDLKETVDVYDLGISNLNNEKHTSFGVYFQVENNDFTKIVINNFSNGKGASVSRFLNAFPNSYAKQVNEYIEAQNSIVEVKDASINNTNTFPSICNKVISVNENLALESDYELTFLNEYFIGYNQKNELVLLDKDNNEIEPAIISLEGINRRSKVTQFLDVFNRTDNSGYNLLLSSIKNYFKNSNKEITLIPRLTYKKDIVLLRKTWFVKKKLLKNILDVNTETDVFWKLNNWIRKNNIPSKVFIRISEQDFKKPQDDNYKPQYIDFESPVFMLLLTNIIEKADDTIEMTEMYPVIPSNENESFYAKEYIVNVN